MELKTKKWLVVWMFVALGAVVGALMAPDLPEWLGALIGADRRCRGGMRHVGTLCEGRLMPTGIEWETLEMARWPIRAA